MYSVGMGAHTYELRSLSIAVTMVACELRPIADKHEGGLRTRAASEAKAALRSLAGQWIRDLEPKWMAIVDGTGYFISAKE